MIITRPIKITVILVLLLLSLGLILVKRQSASRVSHIVLNGVMIKKPKKWITHQASKDSVDFKRKSGVIKRISVSLIDGDNISADIDSVKIDDHRIRISS